MDSPIDPIECQETGRILTEWFEYPKYTDDQLKQMFLEREGYAGVHDLTKPFSELNEEEKTIRRRLTAFIVGKRHSAKFVGHMSKEEVAARLNQASMMVSPDNIKFLPDHVKERTGLTINPLWMMEVMVRSGVLPVRDQIALLKELAKYTHSAAPKISHSTTTSMDPEDWLLALATEEYKTVDQDGFKANKKTPHGKAHDYEVRKKLRDEALNRIRDKQAHDREELFKELEDFEVDEAEIIEPDD